jgi:hypothetical protein
VAHRIVDVNAAFAPRGEAFAKIGAAIMAREALPGTSLAVLEELYPSEVARARFRAIWAQRDSGIPDPSLVGADFKTALVTAFRHRHDLDLPCDGVLCEQEDEPDLF